MSVHASNNLESCRLPDPAPAMKQPVSKNKASLKGIRMKTLLRFAIPQLQRTHLVHVLASSAIASLCNTASSASAMSGVGIQGSRACLKETRTKLYCGDSVQHTRVQTPSTDLCRPLEASAERRAHCAALCVTHTKTS